VLGPAAVSQSDFFEWNPALDPNSKMIPANYRVKVPPENASRFAFLQQRRFDKRAMGKNAASTRRRAAGAGSRQIAAKDKGRKLSLAAARSGHGSATSKSPPATRRIKIASR
jgi:hypothetical protein